MTDMDVSHSNKDPERAQASERDWMLPRMLKLKKSEWMVEAVKLERILTV